MMKHKRILAVILAATLAMSGSLAAGATEAEETQTPADQESESEITALSETGLDEAVSEEEAEEAAADAEEEILAEEGTEIPGDGEIIEDEEVPEEVLEEEEEAEEEEKALPSTDTSGDTELAEIDPALIGYIVETGGIQTYAAYESFSYSYEYETFTKTVDGHSATEILDKTVEIVVANEGGYTTVLANDNNSGALSIGKIGWHADLALTLARLIVAEDNATAWSLLGKNLYNEIIDSSTSWSNRVLTDSEVTTMEKFLDPDQNPASKTIQDELARSYVADYINKAYDLGIRNAAALVYYADIHNQYGNTGGSMGGAKACANYAYSIAGDDWSKVTLNELHLAAISNVAHNYSTRSTIVAYLERRRSTYGKLASCGWTYCNSGDYTIPYDSNGYTGAAWLQVALNSYRKAGLTVTGNYDDALIAAVKSYQSDVGLTADGLAGLHTSTKLIHDIYYNAMVAGQSVSMVTSTGTDIVKIDGVWTYTVNGVADYTYTGLAKNSNGWYYMKNGVLDRTYTGLVKNENGWWYVKDGKLDRSYTGFATNENGSWYMENGKLKRDQNTVIKDTQGALGSTSEWYYVIGSKVQSDFTGLANYKNDSGWWYITNGKVDRSVNTVAKNVNGWWYVKNGKVDKSYTGFATNENGSWYMENGKLKRDQNTVIKDTKGALGSSDEWYYVVGSKVQSDFTGLANYRNSSGWWYITKGKVDRTVNTVAKNKNGWWYVKNGKVDKSYTGFATNENGSWYMENGKLKRDKNTVIKDTKGALGSTSEWYYVVGSKVQSGFTGLAHYKNDSGWWYITNGRVDRSFNGIAENQNGWWYLKNGKVQKSFTGTVTVNGTTYSVTNGKVAR